MFLNLILQPISIPNPFEPEKQKCILCKMNIMPDYKNIKLLSQFVSPFTGRVYGRHITGLCKQKQQQVVMEIIKAQHAGKFLFIGSHLASYYNIFF